VKRHLVLVLCAIALVTLVSGCGKSTAPTALAPTDEAAPAAPTELNRIADSELPQGLLTWTPSPSANVGEYEIYQYQPSPDRAESYVLVGQTDAGTTTYPLPADIGSQILYYRLKAVSPTGLKSDWSVTGNISVAGSDSDTDDTPTKVPTKH
jgi:hypothetical protein